jgi:hypothetical protein
MALDDVRSLLATVRGHFPYVYVFAFHHTLDVAGDMVLLASEAPIDFGPVLAALEGGVAADDLRPFGIEGPAALVHGFVLGPGSLEGFVGRTPINSDDHPRIELNAPRNVLRDTAFDNLEALISASDGALLPATRGADGVGPRLARGPVGAREQEAGLRLVVGDARAPSGLRRREVVSQVAYDTDAGTVRVVGAAGLRREESRKELLDRVAEKGVGPAEDATVGGHSAQRYRGADGAEAIAWSCAQRGATFVAVGAADLTAGVACHP